MELPGKWEQRIDNVKDTDVTKDYHDVRKEMIRAIMRFLHRKGIMTEEDLAVYFDDIIPRS